jgi:hypothetical protein
MHVRVIYIEEPEPRGGLNRFCKKLFTSFAILGFFGQIKLA